MGAGTDDDWVAAAMADDTLAVEMLMRLHDAPPSSSSSSYRKALPVEWTVRQRRSRSQTILARRKKESQRASPTTPLTWSGATSLSGGSEESSRLLPAKLSPAAARSKQTNGESEKGNSKRPRRKKTLSELKEEESSLLKEQRVLKKEIARLRMHLEKQRETNQKLKKIKITPIAAEESFSYRDDESHSKFTLPDLNMPFEQAASPELMCGVSCATLPPLRMH